MTRIMNDLQSIGLLEVLVVCLQLSTDDENVRQAFFCPRLFHANLRKP